MKMKFSTKNTIAILMAMLCIVPSGCKSSVPDNMDLSKAYADVNSIDTDTIVDFDQLTVGSKSFSVWTSRTQLTTKLDTVFARTCGTETIGGTEEATYTFLGSDCTYEGILRERYSATGQVKVGSRFQIGTTLSELLSALPSITAVGTDTSGNTRYSVLVANDYMVKPDNYSTYLTAIRSNMLFPNCTFSLAKLQQELSGTTSDRQKLFATARMALLSDIVNEELDHLLEVSFVVNSKGLVVLVEITLYSGARSLLQS